MEQKNMYPALANSPFTELASAIDHEQTTIEVLDGSKLPDAPNIATIGTAEDAETILYAQKDGNVLSEVTRGFQATAKAWGQGTSIARMFTAYDYDTLRINLQNTKQTLDVHKADVATTTTLGHVMVDGQTITITPSGVIRSEGGFDPDLSYVRIGELASYINQYDIAIGYNAKAEGSGTTGNHAISIGRHTLSGISGIAIGHEASATGDSATALGREASATGTAATALGFNSSATGNAATALGREASATRTAATALGFNSSATGDSATALGHGASADNINEIAIGGYSGHTIVPGDFTVEGTKNFEIPHPKPDKKDTHRIRHGAVESPTAGDTLYRFKVESTKENDLQKIDLPDYFIHLNKDVQIFVTPQGHFGNGYGVLNRETEQLEVHCQFEGEYNVLVIGTRNDDHASVQEWNIKGVEREIGESWTGETYKFSVDEIMEVEEIKEVVA